MAIFNPSNIGVNNGNIFGFPYGKDTAHIHILPIAWEATASFGRGCAKSYQAIRQASLQLDFYDEKGAFWKTPVYMQEGLGEILNNRAAQKATDLIDFLENGGQILDRTVDFDEINALSKALNSLVEETCHDLIKQGKKIIILGGDHSVPLGLIKALDNNQSFGVLHFDAHADLRPGYEGFTYSHASIMHHARQLPNVESITSIGLRDISPEEAEIIRNDTHIDAYSDKWLSTQRLNSRPFSAVINEILEKLPKKIYLSFDVDCLDPSLCPNTGTPVPGGLTWHEIQAFIDALYHSDIDIIGADLCETGNHPWDAQVSARILYQFIGLLS
jgi:agmatinase